MLQEAEHDVGRATARAVPRLPGRDPCRIVAQQLMQRPVCLPAVHSAVGSEPKAVSASFHAPLTCTHILPAMLQASSLLVQDMDASE